MKVTARQEVGESVTMYDVVIVGGRPAGASLAVRLGSWGLSVLIVDKATFPSLPEVPSCPVIHQGTIALFEEIGFKESLFEGVTKIHKSVAQVGDEQRSEAEIPAARGRDYLYGLDRAVFDAALWKYLGRFPKIEARQGFRVVDVLRNPEGRVIGIEGVGEGGVQQKLYARHCVVGADGRHSLISRKVEAKIVQDCSQYTSTVHFAEWDNLTAATHSGEPAVHAITGGRGQNVLFFPSAGGRVNVATHVRSDRSGTEGDAQGYYMNILNSFAGVRQRLAGARQLRALVGVRKIGNRYREHGGPGWVLVGDALHHKDPIDTQGIYDALIESKRLAGLLLTYHQKVLSWEQVLASYKDAICQETLEMFKQTTKAVRSGLYQDIPKVVLRTAMRWLMQDPTYRRQSVRFIAREISPASWLTAGLVFGALGRGIKKDLEQIYRSE